MSASRRPSELDQFDPGQFEINFSSESDVSMNQSSGSPSKYKEDQSMLLQLGAIANLMKKIDSQLAMKEKLLKSDVVSCYTGR
jgi:hypothetical protein